MANERSHIVTVKARNNGRFAVCVGIIPVKTFDTIEEAEAYRAKRAEQVPDTATLARIVAEREAKENEDFVYEDEE